MRMTKTFKKITGMLLALAVVMGMFPAAAMAAPTWGTETKGSITLNKQDQSGELLAGVEYTIYKVADMVQTNGTMEYVSLVSGVTVSGDTKASDFTDDQLAACASAVSGVSDGTNALVFDPVDLGVYVVKETTRPAGVIASNNFVVSVPMTDPTDLNSWLYDVVVTPKNTVFDGSVDKELVSEVTEVGGESSVNIGDELEYKITAKMPMDFYGATDPDDVKAYNKYEIVDTPSTGLELVSGTVVVKVGSTTVTMPAANIVEGTPTGGFTVNLLKKIETTDSEGVTTVTYEPIHGDIIAGATVEITYTAVITEEAINNSPVRNDVTIKYDYDGSDGPGETDPDPDPDPENPELHTYSHAAYKVHKTSGTEAALNDAEFVLKLANGNYIAQKTETDNTDPANPVVTTVEGWMEVTDVAQAYIFKSGTVSQFATFDADGYFSIIGIKGGTHQLIETKAPSGYSLLKDPVNAAFTETTTAVERAVEEDQVLAYTTKIVNVKGFELPGTGEGGIYLYILGGIVLLGAALVLYSKSRKSSLAK